MKKIGIDSSIIISAVHFNHPLHPVSANWMENNLDRCDLITAHHCLLEAYAVLTRLPSDLRVAPTEARDILKGSIFEHVQIADFSSNQMWDILESVIGMPAIGGQAYDGFIFEIMKKNQVDGFATFNSSHFEAFHSPFKIINPAQPE
jgi:hypothetical protein